MSLNEQEEYEPAIEQYGKFYKIHEVYESFSGWYWFVTVKEPYPDEPDIKYGFVVGFEKEWGTFSMSEMKPLAIQGKLWPVPKVNWSSISHVTMAPKSKIIDGSEPEK